LALRMALSCCSRVAARASERSLTTALFCSKDLPLRGASCGQCVCVGGAGGGVCMGDRGNEGGSQCVAGCCFGGSAKV
jgi:hypothetical protein